MELGPQPFGKIYLNFVKYKADKLGWLLQIALCFSKWFISCTYRNDKRWIWNMTCASVYGSNWNKGKDVNFADRKLCAVVCYCAQSCSTLCGPVVYSQPGSSVHGILQARVLEWVAILFSRVSCQPSDRTLVSCTAGGFFTVWATREALRPNT